MRLTDLCRMTGEVDGEAAFGRQVLEELVGVPPAKWRRVGTTMHPADAHFIFELSENGFPNAKLSLRFLGRRARNGKVAVSLLLSAFGCHWRAAGKAVVPEAMWQGVTGPSSASAVRFVHLKDDRFGLAPFFCLIAEDASKSPAMVSVRVEAVSNAIRKATLL